MSNNNNPESFIWGLIRSIKTKRNNKQLLRNIDNQNNQNKGITNYKPSQIEAFFADSDPLGNVVISGGSDVLRARTVNGAARWAYSKGYSVVVIHASNSTLENMIASTFLGIHDLAVFNRTFSCYEPFVGISDNEICRMIQLSATKTCEIRSGARYYIEGMTQFIRSKNVAPYCDMYITCPHLQLFDKVDDAEAKGCINSTLAQQIKSLLVQGQPERSDVENFFTLLGHQGNGILAKKANISKATNIRSVVQKDGIAILDILSSTNYLLLNLAINEIETAISTGKKIMVVFDNIPAASSELMEQFIKRNSISCFSVFSALDTYASLNADDNLFASVVGRSSKIVIYNHSSGLSCTKWAETIGYYEKKEVTNTYTNSSNYQSMFSIIPGNMNSSTINVNAKREYIVKPEEINRMAPNEVYIFDSSNRELAHTTII